MRERAFLERLRSAKESSNDVCRCLFPTVSAQRIRLDCVKMTLKYGVPNVSKGSVWFVLRVVENFLRVTSSKLFGYSDIQFERIISLDVTSRPVFGTREARALPWLK